MQISQIISKNLRSDHFFSTTHFTRSKRISWQYISPQFFSRNYDLRAKKTAKNNFSDGGRFFFFYLNAAQQCPETRLFKVLQKETIKKEIKK